MFSRLDFILQARLRGRPAIVGAALLGAFALSVLLFLLLGNGKVSRVLFFPDSPGRALVAEQRLVPRHRPLEGDVRELVDGVLLGPMRHDLARLFPRGATVQTLVVREPRLYVDLSPTAAIPDAEAPLAAAGGGRSRALNPRELPRSAGAGCRSTARSRGPGKRKKFDKARGIAILTSGTSDLPLLIERSNA